MHPGCLGTRTSSFSPPVRQVRRAWSLLNHLRLSSYRGRLSHHSRVRRRVAQDRDGQRVGHLCERQRLLRSRGCRAGSASGSAWRCRASARLFFAACLPHAWTGAHGQQWARGRSVGLSVGRRAVGEVSRQEGQGTALSWAGPMPHGRTERTLHASLHEHIDPYQWRHRGLCTRHT